jgi:hypothetical protein
MPDNKLLDKLSDEELLEIAKGANVEAVVGKKSEASKFIYSLNIRDGKEAISAMLVFHTYKMWKGFDNKRQAKRYFFRDFNTYFKPYRNKDGMYYLLDPRSFDTSKEEYWRMRADERQQKAKKTAARSGKTRVSQS